MSHDGERHDLFRLSPEVSFHFLGDHVGVSYDNQQRATASPAECRMLQSFSTPRTLAEAQRFLEIDDDLAPLASRFVELGVLLRSQALSSSFRDVLRPEVLGNPEISAAISGALHGGQVCVIRDAFSEAFAERMFAAMDRHQEWHPFRSYAPFFTIECQRIHSSHFPSELIECERVFGSQETRMLMGELTGTDCAGELEFHASLNLPGDHLSAHSDAHLSRSVGFVWLLAKDWQREWGGHFVWCHPLTKIVPVFNCLLLFRVTPEGFHLVSNVTPWAQRKRLSVLGWWRPGTATLAPRVPHGEWFHGEVRDIGERVFTFG